MNLEIKGMIFWPFSAMVKDLILILIENGGRSKIRTAQGF